VFGNRWRDSDAPRPGFASRVQARLRGLDTARALPWALAGGIVIAVVIYLYPPWAVTESSGIPQLDVPSLVKELAAHPQDHPKRLELARYYLQWGLAVSHSEQPLDEIVSDSEVLLYFDARLDEWQKMGQNVTALRAILRRDFATFRKEFVTRERDLAKGMFEQSILYYRQAAALGASLSPRDLYDLGTAYYQMGPEGYAGASRFLGEAVTAGLISTRALTFLGNVSVARGDFDRGISLYRKALDYAPEDPVLTFNLALAYKEREEFDPAIEYFRSTLRLYRDKEDLTEEELSIILQARLALGWCLLKKQQYTEATDEFAAVLEGQPDSVEGHYWMGVAYEGLGRFEAARAHWQKAQSLDAGFRDVKERLALLDRVAQGPATARRTAR